MFTILLPLSPMPSYDVDSTEPKINHITFTESKDSNKDTFGELLPQIQWALDDHEGAEEAITFRSKEGPGVRLADVIEGVAMIDWPDFTFKMPAQKSKRLEPGVRWRLDVRVFLFIRIRR